MAAKAPTQTRDVYDGEAEHMLLALGLGDPRLWPAILARVRPDWCGGRMVRDILAYAEDQMRKGVLIGLAEAPDGIRERSAGDRQVLAELRAQFPGADALGYWCDRVARAWVRREAQDLSRRLWRAASDPTESIDRALGQVAREVANLAAPAVSGQVLAPRQWLEEWAKEAEARSADGASRFLPSGLGHLDREVGVERGDLVILTAQTGVGKTALGIWASLAAARAGWSVLYANTEMTAYQLACRIVAAATGLAVRELRRGWLGQEEWGRAREAMERLSQTKLFLTRPLVDVDIGQVTILAQAHAAQYGLDVLVLDYVGRLDTTPLGGETREYQVLERIARACKGLAQQLRCACWLLVQRTEDGHLAGSRRMRHEADLVLEIVPREKEDPGPAEVTHWIHVTKSRHDRGQWGIGVVFDAARASWREVGAIAGLRP